MGLSRQEWRRKPTQAKGKFQYCFRSCCQEVSEYNIVADRLWFTCDGAKEAYELHIR